MADFDGRLRIRVLQLAQLDSQIWTSMVSGGNDCLEFLNRVSDVRIISGPPSETLMNKAFGPDIRFCATGH